MKTTVRAVLAISAALIDFSCVASNFKPARPPAIPLAVRSPYLNALQFAGCGHGNGGYLAGRNPSFWAGQTLGWAGMIRVDNSTYTWMGDPGPESANQTAFSYTSTRSVFTMEIDKKIRMSIEFLSPVTPGDQKRQSLVFSYLNVIVEAIDGYSHDVQLYGDISAEWVAGDHSSVAQWEFGTTPDGIAYHKVYRQTQLLFSETNDQADWGHWYWAVRNLKGLTFQSGSDMAVRGTFQSNGKLANTKDKHFRPINKDFPVFGFSVDLGSVVGLESTLFTLGMTQEQALQFDGQTGNLALNSLWTSYFSKETDALSFFYNDYRNASEIATSVDGIIENDSLKAGGQNYLTITSLSTRQAFGATQLVGNLTKQYFFIKELSSDGNIQTVDVIYPFFPILLYLEPSMVKLMLDPLYENQESGQFPRNYSMHDLGYHYPNATGHNDGNDEEQPLEECGNMILMTLAYAQRTRDSAYLSNHYNILKKWTQYLIDEALFPAHQMSTDDFAGPLANQTNLALKGIIAIEAMARIANLTGNAVDGANYTTIAHSYISRWQSLGVASDAKPMHSTLSYNKNDTHGILYNLYCDRLLNLKFVPQTIYDIQSEFYPTVESKYGIPLDSRHHYTKSDWEMWAAAISSESTKNMLIRDLAKWINQTTTHTACTDLYDTLDGDYASEGRITHFIARPVVGGHFALLALPLAGYDYKS